MKKFSLLLILSLLTVFLTASCSNSGSPSISDKNALTIGTYVAASENAPEMYLHLYENGTFSFLIPDFSYAPTGTYSIENKILTIILNGEDALSVSFAIDTPTRLIFKEGTSAEHIMPLGTILELRADNP